MPPSDNESAGRRDAPASRAVCCPIFIAMRTLSGTGPAEAERTSYYSAKYLAIKTMLAFLNGLVWQNSTADNRKLSRLRKRFRR